MRDEFPESTKRVLAARVGYLCSKPDCRALTSGPQNDPSKSVNVGVAAHITAASPGGPRYDPQLSTEERSAPTNGIWFCQNCAKKVDNDPDRFSRQVLIQWKEDAELEADKRLGKATASGAVPAFGLEVAARDIDKALDEMIASEEWLPFQRLTTRLVQQRYPDLIASEPKKDLGADARASASPAADAQGKVLACSLTASLDKVMRDAREVRDHFPDVKVFIFATPRRVSNQTAEGWSKKLRESFGFDLVVISREDIVASLSRNPVICKTMLRIPIEIAPDVSELVEKVARASFEVTADWFAHRRLAGQPLIDLRAAKLDEGGRGGEILGNEMIIGELLVGRRVVIEAPAGRGKTTTLIQLAKRIGDANGLAFLIDLPEWAKSRRSLLDFITGLSPFTRSAVDAGSLARVANVEHFSLLFNGWNELSEPAAELAESGLRAVDREFATAGILVATRADSIRPPFRRALRVALLPLTRSERSDYLRAALGEGAQKLGFALSNNRALDELTRTPFILREVTELFKAGRALPTTKMGILQSVVRLLEEAPEHYNELRREPLSGNSTVYLSALSLEMTARGDVTISQPEARKICASAGRQLVTEGQSNGVPKAGAILDALCRHHVLERIEYPEDAFRFEHQQFQEFYGAIAVRKRLWEVLQKGDGGEKRDFMKSIVNEPAWAEPLGMIANDVGGRSDGAVGADAIEAGAMLIRMALIVDPVFAAALAHLCGPIVWKEVGKDVSDRLASLYAVPHSRYRRLALAGMLASGSEDFKDVIVPILSGDNQQNRLEIYRTWTVHLSSLGSDWPKTVSSWPEQARVEFVSELLHQRNVAEIASFARSDPSVKVKEAAIKGLSWVGASDEAAQLLESLDPYTLEGVVQEIDLGLLSASNRDRAVGLLQKTLETLADPLPRVRVLLKQSELGVAKITELKEELGKISGKIDEYQAYFLVKPALDIVRATDASWVGAWVAERVVDGSLWREAWVKLITTVPDGLKEGLIQRLESEDFKHAPLGNIITVLAAGADVAMARRVFLKLCELRGIITRAPDEKHEFERAVERQLEALLRAFPTNIAVSGFSNCFSMAVDGVELDVITQVFSGVASSEPDLLTELDDEMRESFRTYVKNALPFALQQADFSGELKANMGSVLASIGVAADMTEMRMLIQADIERFRRAMAARARGDRSRSANPTSFAMWHVRSVIRLDPGHCDSVLLDLLNEPEYERCVSGELARLVAPAKEDKGFIRKVDYARIWQARSGVREEPKKERRRYYAAAIRDRIDAILMERSSSAQKRPYDFRLRVLGSALAMIDPHGSSEKVFEVMSLPDEWEIYPQINAFETLLFYGVPLPIDKTLTLLVSILGRFRKHGLQHQDEWMVTRFLCLLPFVDDPARGIEKIRELIPELRVRGYQLRDVVEAIGHCRCDGALQFLRELASDKVLAQQLGDAWIKAVAAVDTPESRNLLLSFVDPHLPGLPVAAEFGRDDVLVGRIVELIKRDKAVEQRVLQICETELPPMKRLLLARVVGQFGSLATVLAGLELIDDGATPPVPYELRNQLEAATVEKRPVGGSDNTYTLEPRSSNAIRRKLLEMASKDERRKKSAFGLISQIEEWRLEYGRPTGEARHPALESGEPWPPIPQPA